MDDAEMNKTYEGLFPLMAEGDRAKEEYKKAIDRGDIAVAKKSLDKVYSVLFEMSLHVGGCISELEEKLDGGIVPEIERKSIKENLILMRRMYAGMNVRLKVLHIQQQRGMTDAPVD